MLESSLSYLLANFTLLNDGRNSDFMFSFFFFFVVNASQTPIRHGRDQEEDASDEA